MLVFALVACGHPDTPPAEGAVEITLTTRDGVDLVADEYAGTAGAPGVVLLHMIPPSFDRTSWPADFIAALRAHGWWVIVPDRRGAGESGGNARDAYEGEGGRYDVEACVLRLQADGAGPLALIGASNGTTSVLDYAVWAPTADRPAPTVLGFMTGGDYTETNTPMADVPRIPAVFTFSTDERGWSAAQQPLDPGTWRFLEYADGAHGTGMFEAEPAVTADLDAFLSAKL